MRTIYRAAGLALMLIIGTVQTQAQAFIHQGDNTPLVFSTSKEYVESDWTYEFGYFSRAFNKIGFGAKNLLLGWTDIFAEPTRAAREDEPLLAAQIKGIGDGILNTFGGVAHLLTFPITTVDVALPDGGVSF